MPGDPTPPRLRSLTNEQLVTAYRSGRSEAFEALVRRFRPELLHFLIRFVSNRAAAEDLFQETFLQVHISINTFDTSKRFKPWLFTIAANKARDYLRKNNRRQAARLTVSDDGGEDKFRIIDLLETEWPAPNESVEDAETQQRVRELVDALPDHLREVLVLAYFNQFPYKEIASMLSIPLGTVKSRLHAAVGTFAELWKSRYEAEARE